MKKVVSSILSLTMLLALVSCGSNPKPSTSQAGPPSSGGDSHYVIKFGQADTEDSLMGVACSAFKEYVEANSDGKVEVQLYPNGVMGGEGEMVSNVQMGTLDITSGAPSVLTAYGEKYGLLDLPFLFSSEDHFYSAWDNGLNDIFNSWLSEQNLEIHGMVSFGPRSCSNSRNEIHTPADMTGLKIRVMESPVYVDMFKAMGANPTPMSYTEIYTGLQQHTIDGQDNPAIFTLSAKFYEVQNYYTELGHNYCASSTVIRKGYLDTFPADIAAVVSEGLDLFERTVREGSAEATAAAIAEMADSGVVITYLNDAELQAFRDCTASQIESFRQANDGLEDAFEIIEQNK